MMASRGADVCRGARTQPERFAIYINGVAAATGHADRVAPLTAYCTGLLLPGERKSVEPMAPERVRQMHQSLHHVVADAPWDDDEVLHQVRYLLRPNWPALLSADDALPRRPLCDALDHLDTEVRKPHEEAVFAA